MVLMFHSPVFLVDLVPEAHAVDNPEFETDVTLLQLVRVGAEFHARQVVCGGGGVEPRVEQRVHQGGLAHTRLTWQGSRHG